MKGKCVFTKKIRAVITCLTIIFSFIFSFTFFYLPADADEDIVVSVVAHRGYSSQYPENTLSAFAGAIACGAKTVEFDVRKTKDDVLVIFHDDTLKKITGDDTTIADYTYEELQTLDFGAWYSEDFQYERIATLDEALDLLSASGVRLFVELKKIGDDPDFGPQVYDTCKNHGMLDRIIFLSFDYNYLSAIKELDPNQQIMVLASFGKSDLPERYPADYYGINMKTLTPKTIKSIHEAGAKVYSYTPETKGQVLSLQRMGVDGIITDYPNLCQ